MGTLKPDDIDSPPLTDEQLARMRPVREVSPEIVTMARRRMESTLTAFLREKDIPEEAKALAVEHAMKLARSIKPKSGSIPPEEWNGVASPRLKSNSHLGSSFEGFLRENGILEEVKATAFNRTLASRRRKKPL